ncbi:MAG: DUF4097 and DUF4098 domain-containing protein YvlB [Pseudohongiellaceae bacterium]|jgi:DUF4097 and DUF4098 domain-containing protein YvlB
MKDVSHTMKLSAATMLAMLLGSYLYSSSASAAEARDISKVNGGIRVSAEERVGDISSVNGGIDLGSGASAERIETVNGGIDLDDGVEIERAETVNGGIRLSRDVSVHGSLSTVNGGIQTNPGTVVDRRVSTVNGKIRLRDTRVGENVQTSNGDILLTDGSVVEGDIIVEGRGSWFGKFFGFSKKPSKIFIDADSSVMGDIHLYREVTLDIADGAVAGEIIEHF